MDIQAKIEETQKNMVAIKNKINEVDNELQRLHNLRSDLQNNLIYINGQHDILNDILSEDKPTEPSVDNPEPVVQ